ncbi:HAMP domain-containing protein, partial [Candidatus Daviesbacteria bacterium]|nr:HAMP domain-containing protein [Candidatus Daviesbacteria bacterium]
MKLPKFSLKIKLLLLFIIISGTPMVAVNILWFTSSRNQIIASTASSLSTSASDIAYQVESDLELKNTVLVIHSQTEAILNKDIPKATSELRNFLYQDQDLYELSLIDKNGHELIRISRDKIYPENELLDQSTSPAFRIPTFAGGQQFLSQIFIDEAGQPSIYISIPLVKLKTPQDLTKITTSATGENRATGEIFGVLKASYHLTNLWKQIEELKISKTGYVFLVDDKGNVIAHPNKQFERQQTNLSKVSEVEIFLKSVGGEDNQDRQIRQTKNEGLITSLSTHKHIALTNWGVIAYVPLSDILAQTNQIGLFALILFVIFLSFIILISIGVSKQIVQPIEVLEEGARLIGSGSLSSRIDIKSGDEIERLGEGFNKMADNLKEAFQKVEQDRGIISAERNKLEVTLASVADAVIVVDLNRRIIFFNKPAEKLTGLSVSEINGKELGQLIKIYYTEDNKDYEIPVERYLPPVMEGYEGRVFSRNEIKVVVSKKISYVNLITTQIREGINNNIGGILTLHDITSEKQLEEMKLDFVSMAAHELRTPLTS